MLKQIRAFSKRNAFLRRLVGYYLASSGLFDRFFETYRLSEAWQRRVNDVVVCPDNKDINRCKEAGKIVNGKQYLHNGIRIHLGSYYGPEYARMLIKSKGVHEPQEEKVFAEVLRYIPENATMIELGSFWSFYSMWFNKEIKGARSFMIEPDEFNLGQGKRNFRLNKMNGTFTKAFVGAISNTAGPVPTISVDDYIYQNNINLVHVLHSDIQGFELEMLKGASQSFARNKVAYIFLSTHSNELHYQCLEFLEKHAFQILAQADLDDTFSEDGLIVARACFVDKPQPIRIAKKKCL